MPAVIPDDSPRLPEPPFRILAIASGGAAGTLARYGVDRALAVPSLGFPWPTLVVNVAGSFLLGIIVVLVVERWPPTRFVRPFAVIGFCGGFTTFSTMVVEVAQRGQHGQVGVAAIYLVVSLAAGLLAAAAGIGLGRGRILPPGGYRPIADPDDVGLLLSPPRSGPAADRVDGPATDLPGHPEPRP